MNSIEKAAFITAYIITLIPRIIKYLIGRIIDDYHYLMEQEESERAIIMIMIMEKE